MRYCSHCGRDIKEKANFCEHCGTDLRKNQPEVPAETSTAASDKGALGKFSGLSKRTKLIGAGVALLLILFAGYKLMQPNRSPDEVAERFEKALEGQDAAEMASLLFSEDTDFEITDAGIEKLIAYLNENEDEKKNMLSSLKQQALEQEQYGLDYTAANAYRTLSLTKENGGGYKIAVQPVYFEMVTTYKGTELYADGEKVATADRDKFDKKIGPYMPGSYEFKAVYKTDILQLEKEKEAANMLPNYAARVSLELDGSTAKLAKPFDKGVDRLDLYLNGKKTKMDVLKTQEIQPILIDGSIEAAYEAEFPWGKMRSQPRPISGYYNDIPFIVDQKLQKQLQEAVVLAEKEKLQMMASGGKIKPNTMHPDLAEEITGKAEDLKAYGWSYRGAYLGSDFARDSFTLRNGVEDWEIEVKAKNYLEYAQVYKSEKPVRMNKKEESNTYVFTYDLGVKKWVLTDIKSAYIPDDRNVIKYREKDHKTD